MHRSLLVACALGSITPRALAEPPPPPPPLPAIEIADNHVEIEHSPSISTDILFEVGDTAIKPAARPLLDAIAKVLAKDPSTTLSIGCHTDDTAPDNDRTGVYNQKLSQQRADVVAAYLIKHGIAAKRMIAKGYGRDKPAGDNASDEGKRMNRRLEISIVSDVRPPEATDLAIYTKALKGKGSLIATIATNQGTIHCQLFDDKAPITVANFIGLATGQKSWTDPQTGKAVKKPFYDGLGFHRVIPHFMIQGGDPRGDGTGGPGYAFVDEISAELTHKPGTLAMANAGPGTNGSQFFIDEIEASTLNNHYTVFGQCKEVELVTKIAGSPRGPNDRPTSPVTITKITIARGAL
jgi:peptidyl-prolyl cis-trans isomerase A (cyclophilin A)